MTSQSHPASIEFDEAWRDHTRVAEVDWENKPASLHVELLRCMLWVASLRAVMFLIGVAAFYLLPSRPLDPWTSFPWCNWDGINYLDVASGGYGLDPMRGYQAFFPLYPMLIRLLSPLASPIGAALVISNTCALAGLAVTYLWARQYAGTRTATAGVLLLASFPGSVFLSAGYTEGIMLLVVASTFLLLAREMLWSAALVTGVGTLLRPTCVGLTAVIAVAAWVKYAPLQPWRRVLLAVAMAAIASIGVAAYQGWLIGHFHRLDAYTVSQAQWAADARAAHTAVPHAANALFSYLWSKASTPQLWNRFLGMGMFLIGVAGLLRPGRLPRYLFLLPVIIFLISYLPQNGIRASCLARFESVSLPCFLLVAMLLVRLRSRPLVTLTIAICFLFQGWYAYLFCRGYWVG